MKKCAWLMLLLMVSFPALLVAQTDTVDVLDMFDVGGGEGTLNIAVQPRSMRGPSPTRSSV
ncbi:MAG: hypothetical protein IPI01_08075 [Ignavibacteriae bacterium]|nr:hypothetical protein [Ignavibacteriota bacterium]